MSSGASTGETTTTNDSHSDVSLNELSVTHNNALFAGTVTGACVDSLANVEFGSLAGADGNSSELVTEPMRNTTVRKIHALAEATSARKKKPVVPKPILIEEDRQYLLANTNTNEEYAQVLDESANLWSKAMNTLGNKGGKNTTADTSNMIMSSSDDELPSHLLDTTTNSSLPASPASKKAFDMSHILLDESFGGGEAPTAEMTPDHNNIIVASNKKKRSQMVTPSSDYSIDGESAILWGDDPEKAYFAYMLEQEAEQRAMRGQDQDDSLLGESTRQELMHHRGNMYRTSSYDDDNENTTLEEDDNDTNHFTLGQASKVFGWDPSTVNGGGNTTSTLNGTKEGGISTLTPSGFAQFPIPADGAAPGLPNIIYVQDGTDADPQVKSRNWDKTVTTTAEQPRSSKRSTKKNPHKGVGASTKQLDDDDDEEGHVQRQEAPKEWHASRILIGFALFFLVLTIGLVAALIIYRNHYATVTDPTTEATASNLDEYGNPMVPTIPTSLPLLPPSLSPIYPQPTTPKPTAKWEDDGDEEDVLDDDEEQQDGATESTEGPIVVDDGKPTGVPTWVPTTPPTWVPTKAPSFAPSNATTLEPTFSPSVAPTWTPSLEPSTETPQTARPTNHPTMNPTEVEPVGAGDAPEREVFSETNNATDTETNTDEEEDTEEDAIVTIWNDDWYNVAPEPNSTNTSTTDENEEEEEQQFDVESAVESAVEALTPTWAPTTQPTISTMPPTTVAPTTEPTISTMPPTTVAATTEPTIGTMPPTTVAATTEPTISTMPPTTAATTTLTEAPVAGEPPSPSVAEQVEAFYLIPSGVPSALPTSSEPTQSPSDAPVVATPEPTTLAPTVKPTFAPSTVAPSTQKPTDSPTSHKPTSAPTSGEPTSSPTVPAPTTLAPTTKGTVPPYASLETVRSFILDYSPMSTEDLFDEDSAQFIALEWLSSWMVSIPPRELGSMTKRRIKQRWVLAVIYFTMNGKNWRNGATDWLGNDDACDWISKNNQGNCNEDYLIEVLDLSTNNLLGTIPKEVGLLISLGK